MRAVLALSLGIALILPGIALANTPQCRYIERQIEHYETMAARSEALGSDVWKDRMEGQVNLHNQRRLDQGCPLTPDESAALAFAQLLKVAGQVALSYFTFGAY